MLTSSSLRHLITAAGVISSLYLIVCALLGAVAMAPEHGHISHRQAQSPRVKHKSPADSEVGSVEWGAES